MIIEQDILVETLLEKYPESNRWLLKQNLHCTECGEPVWGTISELVESCGMDPVKVLDELNEYLAGFGYSPKI